MFRRIMCFILAAAAVAVSVCACAGQSGSGKSGAQTSSAASGASTAQTQTGRASAQDSLPDNLDFGGAAFRVYVDDSDHDYTGLGKFFMGTEEETGDVVFDTVLERNRKVEERLNVKFKFTTVSYKYNEVTEATRKIVLSGEDAYDLMIEQQWGNAQLVSEGMFLNTLKGKYFDFSQPWWWNDHMAGSAVGTDKSYFLAGDYFLDLFRSAYIVYFNKNIYQNTFGDPNGLYSLVLGGKWTFDTFGDYSKDIYSDLNGNGKADAGDLFGFTTSVSAITDHFVYGTDVQFTKRDKDGIPSITMNNDRAFQLADKLYKLYYENIGAKLYTDDTLLRSEQEKLFMNNEILFLPYSIGAADILREMENDFGLLPFPKLDESQEKYKILTHDTALMGVVPATCVKLDMVSAVVEALCSESYRTVMPAYYETALKVKYARDSISSQMIDLIHDAISSEFIYIYSYSLNKIGTLYRTMMTNKTSDFASSYAGVEAGALTNLQTLVDAYGKLS